MPADSATLTQLARQIHNLRRERGWSQPELAAKVGASTTMIGRYERGEMTPAVDTVAKLADAFGVTMDHLYHGDGPADAVRDKSMADRLKTFGTLSDADQAHILATFDALMRDAKTRQNYGKGGGKS
jgi:ribosome-binding protein aMBF1 (putative translation factor)